MQVQADRPERESDDEWSGNGLAKGDDGDHRADEGRE